MANLLVNATFSDRAAPLMETSTDVTEIILNGEFTRTLHCAWSRMRDGERVLVVQDITQLRQLEEQMRQTERVAAMGEMAMEVAHEIRNPLGALELFASLLSEEDLTDDDRLRYLANIQLGIRSLNTVLTNMLFFRKRPEPSFEPAKISELLQEVTNLMDPLIQQRSISMKTSFSDNLYAIIDREMTRQIFTNLITNSLNALPMDGELEIRTFEKGGRVFALIRDNGIGISDSLKDKIFSSGFTTSQDGNGLGLAVVKRFLDALGGTIEFESEEGNGTCFTLGFPVENQ
jgi:two-component system sensor histidine kinase FlrB